MLCVAVGGASRQWHDDEAPPTRADNDEGQFDIINIIYIDRAATLITYADDWLDGAADPARPLVRPAERAGLIGAGAGGDTLAAEAIDNNERPVVRATHTHHTHTHMYTRGHAKGPSGAPLESPRPRGPDYVTLRVSVCAALAARALARVRRPLLT